MIAFPRDVAGNPVPCEVVNQPLVVDGADCFLVYVRAGGMETWTLETIRAAVAAGLPITLAA